MLNEATHKHHIIPKHAGGTDDPSNLIELTIEAHAEATKITQKQPKSVEWKRKMSERMSGANNPRYGKPGTMNGKITTKEAKEKQRTAKLGTTFRACTWGITLPDGTQDTIINLAEYCRVHNLHQGMMVLVSQGLRSQHKGYRCKKICDK